MSTAIPCVRISQGPAPTDLQTRVAILEADVATLKEVVGHLQEDDSKKKKNNEHQFVYLSNPAILPFFASPGTTVWVDYKAWNKLVAVLEEERKKKTTCTKHHLAILRDEDKKATQFMRIDENECVDAPLWNRLVDEWARVSKLADKDKLMAVSTLDTNPEHCEVKLHDETFCTVTKGGVINSEQYNKVVRKLSELNKIAGAKYYPKKDHAYTGENFAVVDEDAWVSGRTWNYLLDLFRQKKAQEASLQSELAAASMAMENWEKACKAAKADKEEQQKLAQKWYRNYDEVNKELSAQKATNEKHKNEEGLWKWQADRIALITDELQKERKERTDEKADYEARIDKLSRDNVEQRKKLVKLRKVVEDSDSASDSD